ncbi:UPF0102 protein [Paenibacillus segetis]|uniref:UPF0102 protein GCM10008013_12070 n=2 Tax=Paenibacillus segetis TaxID=1325360 RepID=A0ABQ1Y9V5_9BACL|nr:UPF0102 protein [Paenibacillus segetis]
MRDDMNHISRSDGRKAKGQLAEQAAADYLFAHGYEIVERNWRCRSGEIDIVAIQDDVIVIVEVRSRSSYASSFGTPSESITARKMKQVRDTAAVYLHHVRKSNAIVRFDVLAITLNVMSH